MFVLPVQEPEEKKFPFILRFLLLSVAFFLSISIVGGFLGRRGNYSLPKATFNKKTGQPKVKNLIANGDFLPQVSTFGKIIFKIKPPKPNQNPPQGWQFYKEELDSASPEIKIITEEPYIYIKESAIYINTKDKGVGLSQEISAKPPLFIQANVLVMSGKVELSLLDTDGKEMAASQSNPKNLGEKNWERLTISLSDTKRQVGTLVLSAKEPNTTWYMTNVVIHSEKDYPVFFEKATKREPSLPDEKAVQGVKLFYYGKEVTPSNKKVLGATTLGSSAINVSQVFFEYTFLERFRTETVNWIGASWADAGINKIIDTSSTQQIIFDPFTPSPCEVRGAWVPSVFYMPEEWCQSDGAMKIALLKVSFDGFMGDKRIFINSNGDWYGIKHILKHELGHALGAPDSDFVGISGNRIFPQGNHLKEEYIDVMSAYGKLNVCEYTRGSINFGAYTNSGDLKNQLDKVNFIDYLGRPVIEGKYSVFLGRGTVHGSGTIVSTLYKTGYFQDGTLVLGDFFFRLPFTAAFLAVETQNVLLIGQFDVLDLCTAKFRNLQSYPVSLQPSGIGVIQIIFPTDGAQLRNFSSVRARVAGILPINRWKIFAEVDGEEVLLANGDQPLNENSVVVSETPQRLKDYLGSLDLVLQAEYVSEELGGYILTVRDKRTNIIFEPKPLISSVEFSYNDLFLLGEGFGNRDRDEVTIKINPGTPNELVIPENQINVVEDNRLQTGLQDYRVRSFEVLTMRNMIASDIATYNRGGVGESTFNVITAPLDFFLDPYEGINAFFEFYCLKNIPKVIYGVDTSNRILGADFYKNETNCQKDRKITGVISVSSYDINHVWNSIQGGNEFSWFICGEFPDPGNSRFSEQDPEIIKILNLSNGNNLFYDCVTRGIDFRRRSYESPLCSCEPTTSKVVDLAYCERYRQCYGPDTENDTSWNYTLISNKCYGNDFWCRSNGVPPAGRCDCSVSETRDITNDYPDQQKCLGKNNILGTCYLPRDYFYYYFRERGWRRRWEAVDRKCFLDIFRCGTFPTPTPQLTLTPTPQPFPIPTSRPTPTPTPLPQFSQCGSCSSDAWGGCTPPEKCRLINDQTICRDNNKPGTPCCIRDQSCSPGFQQACGYGDPNIGCGKCSRFWNNPPNGPWCTNWQLDCGAGKPASPRLKAPNNDVSVSGETPITLSWYAFGEGLFYRCGEALPANWSKWEDCNQAWHFASRASCIPENTSGRESGDRSCWGYVCAKGSDGINPEWRFYTVLIKDEDDADFREICTINGIPNTAINSNSVGTGLPVDKSSCSFTSDRVGQHQWKLRAGYSVNTGGGAYIDYNESQIFNFVVSSLPQPTNTPTPTPSPSLLNNVDQPQPNISCSSPFDFSGWTIWENGQRVEKVEFYMDLPKGQVGPYGEALTDQFNRPDLCRLNPLYCRAGWKWRFNPARVNNGPHKLYVYAYDADRGYVGEPIVRDFLVAVFTPTPTSMPTPTSTPAYTAQCDSCRPYTSFWLAIPDLTAGISIGQTVNFSTRGSTGHPAGITKARFRVNGGADSNWCTGGGMVIVDNWCETTLKHEAEFYVPYPVRSAGAYTVESMVFNPDLGWY